MKDKAMAIYIFVDDFLTKIGHKEPEGRRTSDAEVITTAIVVGLYFKGHLEHAISSGRRPICCLICSGRAGLTSESMLYLS